MKRTSTKPKAKPKRKKTPRTRKPAGMTVEEWQVALRREYGREQDFGMKNVGSQPIFSEFIVTNPATGGAYRVAIRGQEPGGNYCTCPDFTVNTLGTCKHIEFTLAKLEGRRGAKKAFREGFHPAYSSVYLRYGARREVRFRPGAECPRELLAYAARFFDGDGVLLPDAYARFHAFMKDAPRNGHELRCYEDAVQFVAKVRDRDRGTKAIEEAFPKGTLSPRFDKLIKTRLYPYQCQGALFAAKAGRCLLADDMGLGKTIQAIAAIEMLALTAGVERVLVIAPTSLKYQWKQEIERFADRSAEVTEGPVPKRAASYETDTFYKITNYDVVHRDSDLIARWAPDVIVLDEAQRIKNWQTRRARGVKRLESEYAIVLTGTPLENRLEELHSIVEFVDRFRLGPLFKFLDSHQQADEFGKVVGYRDLSGISRTLGPILLRRTKDEVLTELPERVDKYFYVPMTDEQWKHHQENKQTVGEIVQKWRRLKFLSEKDQRRLMIAMQNMRMSCNSTYLLDQTTDYGVKADEVIVLLEDMLEQPGAKAVIFSQWLRTHELILRRLESRPWGHVFYHGSVPSAKRKDLVQRFKEDPECRLFLATDSGGVGLNLQNASAVINMDQPWNPAVLEQRIGRVHRLGQSSNVRVVHFVAQGTIEHGMLSVLAFKKSVFAGVLDGGEDEVFLGGSKLKKFMDTVDNVTGGIPESMPRQESADEDAAEAAKPSTAEEDKSDRQPAQLPEVWGDLLATGLDLAGKLGQALQAATAEGEGAASGPGLGSFIAKDSETGQAYLKLPMPEPDTLKTLANVLGTFANALQTTKRKDG